MWVIALYIFLIFEIRWNWLCEALSSNGGWDWKVHFVEVYRDWLQILGAISHDYDPRLMPYGDDGSCGSRWSRNALIPHTHFLLSTSLSAWLQCNFLSFSGSALFSEIYFTHQLIHKLTHTHRHTELRVSYSPPVSVVPPPPLFSRLPAFSLSLAVHWLLRIDSSASWLCIMCLSSPHVSRRICQISSYDLSCTCLNSTLWSRNMKGSLQRAASLTSDELVSFSSASVLEFQMYIPSVQIESLAFARGSVIFYCLPSLLTWNWCFDCTEKGVKGTESESGRRGISCSCCWTQWEWIMPIVFLIQTDSDWPGLACSQHGKCQPFAILGLNAFTLTARSL